MGYVGSDFLVAQPHWTYGVARLFDWVGCFDAYNHCRNVQEADAGALYSDWRIVGQDIMNAMQRYELEISEPKR